MNIRLDDSMKAALSAITFNGNKATMPALTRADYVKVNKVLEAAGGKWDRKAKAHVFASEDAQQQIADAVISGQIIEEAKKVYNYFQTPEKLAARMAEELCIDGPRFPRLNVLEPSCGGGRLIEACLARNCDSVEIFGIEMESGRHRELKTKLLDGWKSKYSNPRVTIEQLDFLDAAELAPGKPGFDRIIMNPPFSGGRDVDHFTLAFKLLKPGGRIVAITSPGWTFRSDKRHAEFRRMIEDEKVGQFDVEELPEDTFKESGTGVRAMLICGDKTHQFIREQGKGA